MGEHDPGCGEVEDIYEQLHPPDIHTLRLQRIPRHASSSNTLSVELHLKECRRRQINAQPGIHTVLTSGTLLRQPIKSELYEQMWYSEQPQYDPKPPKPALAKTLQPLPLASVSNCYGIGVAATRMQTALPLNPERRLL